MDVAIVQDLDLDYCREIPYHPSTRYPEYPFEHYSTTNRVYDAIRTLFFRLGLDRTHYNMSSWNPLGRYISPGDSVVIKPNLVRHYNPVGGIEEQITHGSVIRAVLDYAYIALQGQGTITIGDAPVQSCRFKEVTRNAGLDQLTKYYNENTEVKLRLVDFRKRAGYPRKCGKIQQEELDGDPEGYTLVNLGDYSELTGLNDDYQKFRVTNYDKRHMQRYHNADTHCYVIANSCLQADVIINLPKLKTHRKAGMTGALKNMVGIIGSKDCLPHHRAGSQNEGGDEYLHKDTRKRVATYLSEAIDTTDKQWLTCLQGTARLLTRATKYVLPHRDDYYEGSWYGNDTIPRTIVDLNRIVKFADKQGILQLTPQRRNLTIVDAIIAGEKEGPLEPSPKPCGTLIAGENPVAVDLVCSQFMGFDYCRIPTLIHAMHAHTHSIFTKAIEEVAIQADDIIPLHEVYAMYGVDFTPTSGWEGHIERTS
jgi:uncharacterized protein (DUF362 family)